MRLSARVQRITESATLRVSRLAGELRARGEEVIDFGAGEPDFDSPPVAVEAARRAISEGFTKYTPAAGIPDLRRALANRYRDRFGAPWEGGDVLVSVGAKGALFELALALFDEGDEVVVPSPCWVSFPEQIRFADAAIVAVPMRREEGFRIRSGPLLDAVTDATRAVLVNSPCNPTGGVIGSEDLERLAAACHERGIVLVADETYERFVYDGAHFASAASLADRYPETIVVVGSFSKTYAMTGWRVGFALGPRTLIDAVSRIQGHATSNPTSFAMVGALAALEGAEPDVEAMLAEYQARRDALMERLGTIPGLRCLPPAGAFYAFPDVSDFYGGRITDSVQMAEHLLSEAGVAVVPGAAFGADDHVRISFACSREALSRGLDRMAEALGALTR